MKGIVILGSTGSVGRQTLDIVRSFPDYFRVIGLAGWSNTQLLRQQIQEFQPPLFSCKDLNAMTGVPGVGQCRGVPLEELASAPEADLVMMAIMGKAGLMPILAAIKTGKQIALANKEPIVMAGELVVSEAERYGATLLPVDSEPSAIWQCLTGEDQGIENFIITASGGAFRNRPQTELHEVTAQEALKHPTWTMGKKITIDSATLMNKAFEVAEIRWLFNMPWEKIQVVVHPQSIVHAMVTFADGSVKAQLSPPDMRMPIQYALFHPHRTPNPSLPRFNPAETGTLVFEALDPKKYPCFELGLAACRKGGTYPAVLNGADEAAVNSFLSGRIKFGEIPHLLTRVLDAYRDLGSADSIEGILQADSWGRAKLLDLMKQHD